MRRALCRPASAGECSKAAVRVKRQCRQIGHKFALCCTAGLRKVGYGNCRDRSRNNEQCLCGMAGRVRDYDS